MFKNETKNAMMAFAVVAMFMLSACAIAIIPASDAAEVNDASYTINMKKGDSFEYTPEANLTGTTFKWAKTTGNVAGTFTPADATTNGTTFKFTPSATGNMTVTLTATNTLGGFNQTATQVLHFKVVDKLAVSGTEYVEAFNDTIHITANSEAVAGTAATNIGSYAVTGGNGAATFSNVAVHAGTVSGSASTVITESLSTDSKTLYIGNVANPAAGTYYVTATVSYTINSKETGDAAATTLTESKQVAIQVIVAPGMELAVNNSNTINGTNNGNPVAITINNTSGISDLTISKGTEVASGTEDWKSGQSAAYLSGMTLTQGTDAAVNTASIALPTNIANETAIADGKDKATIKFNIHVEGTNQANQDVSADLPYTLNVYRSLKFTTTPTVTGTVTFSSSVNGLDVLVSTNVDGANKITYVWGDGTEYTRDVIDIDNTLVAANHTYASAGTYFIQITASNDFGDKTTIIPYTTGASIIMDAEKTLKMTGIKETVDAEANTIVLDPTVIVTAGNTVAYKWTYSIDGAEAVELTAAGTPAWFKTWSADHKSITISTAQADELPANVKFTCEASVTFEGDEKATTSSASYTYKDSHFMAQNGWIVWVALALLVIGIVLIVFVTGPIMPVCIFTGVAAVLTVILFLAKMYMWF